MKKATVFSPSASVYGEASSESILQDELLYGMEVTVDSDVGLNGMCRVTSDYGYSGFVSSAALYDGKYPANRVVTARSAHLMKQACVDSVQADCVPQGSLLLCVSETADGWSLIQPVGATEIWYTRTSWLSARAEHIASERVFRQNVIRTAMGYLHTPYRFGGKTPQGIDCSGLCSISYLINGAVIWRDAVRPPKGCVRPISLQEAKPADLLYFPGHMALYLGENRFLHATAHTGDDGVCIGSFQEGTAGYRGDLKESFLCAGTIF